jgi:hypothetical protein
MMKSWSFIQNSASILFANAIGFHCTWVVKASVSGFPSQVDKFEQNSVSGHQENASFKITSACRSIEMLKFILAKIFRKEKQRLFTRSLRVDQLLTVKCIGITI